MPTQSEKHTLFQTRMVNIYLSDQTYTYPGLPGGGSVQALKGQLQLNVGPGFMF